MVTLLNFDLSAQILRVEFLSDKEKRNILGGNAHHVFGTEKIPNTPWGRNGRS
jgi:hypothetical protein